MLSRLSENQVNRSISKLEPVRVKPEKSNETDLQASLMMGIMSVNTESKVNLTRR